MPPLPPPVPPLPILLPPSKVNTEAEGITRSDEKVADVRRAAQVDANLRDLQAPRAVFFSIFPPDRCMGIQKGWRQTTTTSTATRVFSTSSPKALKIWWRRTFEAKKQGEERAASVGYFFACTSRKGRIQPWREGGHCETHVPFGRIEDVRRRRWGVERGK